ncbi:PRA1 family protein [Aphelenchoides avenae]|nr:PRA1 family protein [Aphelenchus avenae]
MSSRREPSTATAISSEVEFAPFRPLGEFLLDQARFELPPVKDLPKWNNRIVTNLLYFQTNYFILSLFLVLSISLFHARDVVIGFSAVALLGTVLVFSLTKNPKLMQFRAEHPYIVLVAIVISAYYFINVLPSVVTLMFTFAVPLLLILTHASIRFRNFSAKVNQKLEVSGLRSTVMARILSACGIGLSS